jgi:hypothetical protein
MGCNTGDQGAPAPRTAKLGLNSGARQFGPVRDAVERICKEDEIGRPSRQLRQVIGVARGKLAVASAALGETMPRDFQQRRIDVDCRHARRNLCDLQREPAVARAEVDDVHAV